MCSWDFRLTVCSRDFRLNLFVVCNGAWLSSPPLLWARHQVWVCSRSSSRIPVMLSMSSTAFLGLHGLCPCLLLSSYCRVAGRNAGTSLCCQVDQLSDCDSSSQFVVKSNLDFTSAPVTRRILQLQSLLQLESLLLTFVDRCRCVDFWIESISSFNSIVSIQWIPCGHQLLMPFLDVSFSVDVWSPNVRRDLCWSNPLLHCWLLQLWLICDAFTN